MANFDNQISVDLSTDAAPVPAVNFGIVLLIAAAGTLGGGFTERTRSYEDAAGVAADLASGAITSSVAAALTTWLAQPQRTKVVKVGRVGADVAQVHTFVITGAAAGAWVVTIINKDGDTETATFTADGDDTTTEIGTGLRAALNALNAAAGPIDITVGGSTTTITLTAETAGEGFTATLAAPGSGTRTTTATTANKSIKTELDAIVEADGDFYCVVPETRTALQLTRTAAWTESAGRKMCVLQSSDADLLTTDTTDIASVLGALSYKRSVVLYHNTNSEHAALAWAVFKLAADPDQQVTQWSYPTLVGITPQTNAIVSTTQKNNLTAKNCNVYGTFASAGSMQKGQRVNGEWIDSLVSMDWTGARVNEALQQMMIDNSNRNLRINLNAEGIATAAGAVDGVLKRGEVIGHFEKGTTKVTPPKAKDISSGDRTARRLRIPFEATLTVGTQEITSTGYVTVALPA